MKEINGSLNPGKIRYIFMSHNIYYVKLCDKMPKRGDRGRFVLPDIDHLELPACPAVKMITHVRIDNPTRLRNIF